ncbi:MAG: molybdopterin-dependent oxidoreductase [Gammaproteobacteria bacterium]|nr:molybdopterin-dependent oxidoreductase [Gammaproteobacteria bacterium]
MKRLALMIDLERCIGCKSCEVACKQEHGLGPAERRNRVVWFSNPDPAANEVPQLNFLALACQQCERPACLRACPTSPKAITRDPHTGIVEVNETTCVGCGECVVACPYGAMGYDAIGHHAVKCDLCAERRRDGAQTTACASVCPGKAIHFGERDALLDLARDDARQVLDTDPFLLSPATVVLGRNNVDADTFQNAIFSEPKVVDPIGAVELDASQFPYRESRDDRRPDRTEPGGCNICFNCCTTKFHFRNDRLVKVTGNEDDPVLGGRVCPKSQLTLQLYDSEHRLRQPLKRVGARGENKFEPVSWEQALNEIAEKLRGVRENFGSESLGIFTGTRTGTLTNRGYIRLFSQLWGTPNVETTEPFCSSGKNMAYGLVQGVGGSGNSYTPNDLGAAELYVYIGDNQAETRPVHFGMINDWRLRRGARLIAVDPRLTVTASKADWHLPIRPGTDLALALAMAYHIIENRLYDAQFCEEWVEGFEAWRDFLLEKNYSPQWAQSLTSLSAEDIEQLAEEIAAADGCVIFASRGVNQHVNSTQTNRALMFVAAITGNWGRRGGAFFNMSASVPIGADAPIERRAPIARSKVRISPTGWTDAIRHGQPYPLKALITCNNPAAMWPGQNEARDAFAALDLLVHIDLFPNETSAYADYVLPAATGIEKGEVGRACEDRRVVWIDKMIEPPGEAKPDGWIWIELGKRFGFDDVLKEEWKDSARFWDEVLIDNPQMRGCTQKRLHSTPWRWVRFPVASESAPEQDTLYLPGTTAAGAPEGHRFPTPSGKLEFWTPELEEKFVAHGLSALPEFYADRESLIDLPHIELLEPDSAEGIRSAFAAVPTLASPARIVPVSEAQPIASLRAQGYDLDLVTGRPPAPQFHSWMHYAWQAQEMWPDLYAQMHPTTAESLGIRDGQTVRVETAHGEATARAWVYAGIRERAVFMPIGWGEHQPYNPWQPVNFLTDKTQRDPLSEQTNLKSLLCRVSPL